MKFTNACNIFDYDYPKYMGKQIINDTAQWNDILNHYSEMKQENIFRQGESPKNVLTNNIRKTS